MTPQISGAIAHALGAASSELRATTRLARLLVDRGARNDAAILLAETFKKSAAIPRTLSSPEAGDLLRSIESDNLVGLRDRALIGVMIFTFARASAA